MAPTRGADRWVRFYRLDDLTGVQPVAGAGVDNDFPRHVHDSLCVGVVDQGHRRIVTAEAEELVGPGEAFAINPGQPHACSSVGEEGQSYLVLCLAPDAVRRFASSVAEAARPLPRFEALRLPDPALVAGVREFFAALVEDAMAREQALHAVLARLVTRHAAELTAPCDVGDQRAAVARVREHIDARCRENLRLEDLSRVARLSPFHLQRVFTAEVGVSPRDYLLQRRSRLAASLLDRGMDIAAAAAEAGFVDQSHLTRVFKRHVGVTPGRYRPRQR